MYVILTKNIYILRVYLHIYEYIILYCYAKSIILKNLTNFNIIYFNNFI